MILIALSVLLYAKSRPVNASPGVTPTVKPATVVVCPSPGDPVWPTSKKQVVLQYGITNGIYHQYSVLASNANDPVRAVLGGILAVLGNEIVVTNGNTSMSYGNVTPEATAGAVTSGTVIGTADGNVRLCASMRGEPFDPVAMFWPKLSGLAHTSSVAVSTDDVGQVFQDASAAYGVNQYLLEAMAIEESGLDPRSLSSAGAQGVMQLLPSTAQSQGVNNPYDFTQNVYGGARYLRELLDEVHGNIPDALAAYNAGPGEVEKYGGPPPYTQGYINSVMALYHELGGS